MKKEKGRYYSTIIAAIVAIVAICVIAVALGVLPFGAFPSNYIGAALGSFIGALITLILLRGQTEMEEDKGRNIRILKKKMKVFRKYINTVWKVWEDQKITIDEFQDLTSQYYQNIMIYLKEDELNKIGTALTMMGKKIDKNTYDDTQELRKNIVTIINTLSADIGLGGEINTKIMDDHDKILFPILFKKKLLDELNKNLKTNNFKEGKYETIKENGLDRIFITFEMEKFPDVFLAIWVGGGVKGITMAFMASDKLDAEFRRRGEYKSGFRYRFGLDGHPVDLSKPIPNDEDNTTAPPIDFTNEESIQVFREREHDFPSILAKRVLYRLGEWKEEDLGISEFLEKKLEQVEAK
jgi:hypothetical protein